MNGFDLAVSGDISLDDSGMMDYLKDSEEYKALKNKKNKHADPFTIAVLVFCVGGLIINFAMKKFGCCHQCTCSHSDRTKGQAIPKM